SWEGAYDTVIQGMCGLISVTGFPDGPPIMVGEAIADCLTGTMAFGAIGAALFDRERTVKGAHIDIAMFDCMLTMMQCALAIYLRPVRRLGGSATTIRSAHRSACSARAPVI